MDSDTSRSLSSSEVSSVSTPTASGTKSSAARRKKKRSSVTVPKPFNLSLDHRVGERMRYDSSQRQRQEEQEKVWRERREKEEEEARKEMRKKVGFKANPVRVFKPMMAPPSSKPLTVPEPPTLLTALLSEQRKAGCRDTRASSTGSSRENSTSPLNPYTGDRWGGQKEDQEEEAASGRGTTRGRGGGLQRWRGGRRVGGRRGRGGERGSVEQKEAAASSGGV